MGFVLSQEGGVLLWQYILGILSAVNPFVHLLGSTFTPAHTSVLSNFAGHELPLASGYAPIQLTNPGANWTLTPIAAGALATHTILPWTFTGALSVYGYYLSDDTHSISWGGELLADVYTFPSSGGLFTLSLPPYLISCPGVTAC